MYDVTVIGPSVIDILAAPFDPDALAKGKRDVDQIRMSFGGDALNESVVLSRLGKKVQLISKIGADEAGRSIRKHLEKDRPCDCAAGLEYLGKYCPGRCRRRKEIFDGSAQQPTETGAGGCPAHAG